MAIWHCLWDRNECKTLVWDENTAICPCDIKNLAIKWKAGQILASFSRGDNRYSILIAFYTSLPLFLVKYLTVGCKEVFCDQGHIYTKYIHPCCDWNVFTMHNKIKIDQGLRSKLMVWVWFLKTFLKILHPQLYCCIIYHWRRLPNHVKDTADSLIIIITIQATFCWTIANLWMLLPDDAFP